jgi:hypothetical protein
MSFVVMPSDVEALQKQVRADATAVAAALQRCADAGTFSPQKTPSDWDAWNSMNERTKAFLAESPSFLSSANQYERGEAIQKELAGWHDKARALGCDAGPAPTLPSSGDGFGSFFAGMSSSALLILLALWALRK